MAHALEGDGKVKYGYGVYVTSSYRSAAHYAGTNPTAQHYYVYTVEIPEKTEDNFIAIRQPVPISIVQRAEAKLGVAIPEKVKLDGKVFRKYLAEQLTGEVDLEGEKAASRFLLSIGVEFIEWPFLWKYPDRGTNRAVLDDGKVRLLQVEEVDLDKKEQLVEGSQRLIKVF